MTNDWNKQTEIILKEWVAQSTPELNSLMRIAFKAGKKEGFDEGVIKATEACDSTFKAEFKEAEEATLKRAAKELQELSFAHNPIGKQRIDNFIKKILKQGKED